MSNEVFNILDEIASREKATFSVREVDLKRKTATFLCPTHGLSSLKLNIEHKYACKLCARVETREEKKTNGSLSLEYYQAKTLEKFGKKYQITSILGFRVHRRVQVSCQKHGLLAHKWVDFIAKGCQKCYKEDNYVPKTREILTYDYLTDALYNKKLRVEEVGAENGLSANTIRQRCRILNVKLPKRPRGLHVRKP